jgi:hypothetical protein
MKTKNQKGQSTIEFILTFTVTVGFIFLFLQMAINYTNGYLIHHATYMASRSYLTSDAERLELAEADTNAFNLARATFKRYMPAILKADFSKFQVNGPSMDKKAFVGAYFDFTQIFSLGFIGGKEEMFFRSESFLGREPTRVENYSQICKRMKSVLSGLTSCKYHMTLDDNGG